MSSTNSGVFSVYAASVIDAPRETVWKALLDFQSYGEWNPFVRSQMLTDKSMNTLADQSVKLEVGQYLRLAVHIPPTMDDSASTQHSDELVTECDHDNFRVAWKYIPPVPGIMAAERWQMLTEVGGKTKYETQETFSGVLAYLVRFLMQKKLQLSFDAMASSLKQRAEQQ